MNEKKFGVDDRKIGVDNIGAQGAKYLSQNTPWTNLKELYLDKNSIGVAGAKYLSQNTSWKSLQTLYLDTNSIGIERAISFR